ncbi:MAG: hypothetical protein ISR65_04910 [Bacteriovoracaceae bacterium]|nr:hypothetical protein [Bacteriovoracaceae bacterium]
MRLSRALRAKTMDSRLREKHLAEEKITHEEELNYLKSLPDDAENMTYVEEKSAAQEENEEGEAGEQPEATEQQND